MSGMRDDLADFFVLSPLTPDAAVDSVTTASRCESIESGLRPVFEACSRLLTAVTLPEWMLTR